MFFHIIFGPNKLVLILTLQITIFRFSPTNRFCKQILPKMIGIGQLDKVEDIKTGKTDKLQSNLTPGVLASYMIH